VELSYGGIYARRAWDGPLLPYSTLVKLIAMADMFDFHGCVGDCREELMRARLGSDDVIHIIDTCISIHHPPQIITAVLHATTTASFGPLRGLWKQGQFCLSSPRKAVSHHAGIPDIKVS